MSSLNLTDRNVYEKSLDALFAANDDTVSLVLVDMSKLKRSFSRVDSHMASAFLKRMAQLMHRLCRNDDSISRIGDFTFALTFAGLENEVMQQLAAEKILRLYGSVTDELDTGFGSGIAIGIASYPRDGARGGEVIRAAGIALEAAETSGDLYRIYSPDTHQTMSLRWAIQSDLAEAVHERDLAIVYQPQVDARSGLVIGAEALCRWTHAQHGPVSPDVFIPLAVDMGLIEDLTGFILSQALRDVSRWPVKSHAFQVSVNFDPAMLRGSKSSTLIRNNLAIWGDDSVNLTIEVTESSVMRESENDFDVLQGIRDLGVGVAIDDFGTGFSSLSKFRSLPASELKIDRSFIRGITSEPKNRQLVETIVALAHGFNMRVVAEGVETAEQRKLLREVGCDILQGYLIGRPMPEAEFLAWLADWQANASGSGHEQTKP